MQTRQGKRQNQWVAGGLHNSPPLTLVSGYRAHQTTLFCVTKYTNNTHPTIPNLCVGVWGTLTPHNPHTLPLYQDRELTKQPITYNLCVRVGSTLTSHNPHTLPLYQDRELTKQPITYNLCVGVGSTLTSHNPIITNYRVIFV